VRRRLLFLVGKRIATTPSLSQRAPVFTRSLPCLLECPVRDGNGRQRGVDFGFVGRLGHSGAQLLDPLLAGGHVAAGRGCRPDRRAMSRRRPLLFFLRAVSCCLGLAEVGRYGMVRQ